MPGLGVRDFGSRWETLSCNLLAQSALSKCKLMFCFIFSSFPPPPPLYWATGDAVGSSRPGGCTAPGEKQLSAATS